MSAVLLARYFPDRSLVVHNLTLFEAGAATRVQTLAGRDELVRAVAERFGIPAGLATEAMDGLDLSRDAWD